MNTIYSPKTTFQITFLVLQTLLCEQTICQNIDSKTVLLENNQTYANDIGVNISYPPNKHNVFAIPENSRDSVPTFEIIQFFSQEVDRNIASAFLNKERLYYNIQQGNKKQDIEVDLKQYGEAIYSLGIQYNKLQNQIIIYIENKTQQNIGKDTVYALVAYQQQIYQNIKNLFIGSYRFRIQQYENPYYNVTFEQFLASLPEYRERYAYSFDLSNDIEDPSNSLYFTQYQLCDSRIEKLSQMCQFAIKDLDRIQEDYYATQNELALISELKAFKSKQLDPIYGELSIVLSLFNVITQNQIFHYMRFHNTNNLSAVKLLEGKIKYIGCIEKDATNEGIDGICDVLFERYNKLSMLPGGNDVGSHR